LGIGDWGLGPSPIPNPQSPIPNPQSPPFKNSKLFILKKIINYLIIEYFKNKSNFYF
jgi:hypothetical protein